MAGGLPEVYVERLLMVDALVNLIENSAKYASDSPQPKIDSDIEIEADGATTFFFQDNGPGIDPDEAEKIFELFFNEYPTALQRGVQFDFRYINSLYR